MRVNLITSVLSQKFPKNSIKLKNLIIRNKSFNSHEWLKRRETDPYLEIAKQKNYRCRSAFKLIQIDDQYKLIKPGFKVLDIGAAPGSWSQVLAERTNSNASDPSQPVGLVIAVDLNLIPKIDGVIALSNMDFQHESTHEKILELLGEEKKFDFIVSDMAPSATGLKQLDQERIFKLIYSVILFSVKNLKVDGGCLVKLWSGGEDNNAQNQMKKFFKLVNFVKPKATYNSSSEIYLLGREFLGLNT